MDLIHDKLKIPIKRQGYLDMYNGVNIQQTRYCIKIGLKTYVDKIFEPYFATWMKTVYPTSAHSNPLPSDHACLKKFNGAVGDPDEKVQAQLAKSMQLNYCAGVGELIWAMTTCRPDLAFASIKISQSNSCPHKFNFHGLKHDLKYLYASQEDGIYFWRTSPRLELPKGPVPTVNSNKQDILLEN